MRRRERTVNTTAPGSLRTGPKRRQPCRGVVFGQLEIEEAMDYQALITSSLMDIGVDVHGVQQIEAGAMLYGDAGFLDSVYLVALIAAIEERLTVVLTTPVDLFGDRGVALLDEFKDIQTLASFLKDRVTGNATAREWCREIK